LRKASPAGLPAALLAMASVMARWRGPRGFRR
jgi:hypothetical protein